jgi:hypothetical protein
VLTQRLLTDRATILTATQGAKDALGNATVTWSPDDPVPALLQQQVSSELIDQRDTVTTRAVAFLLPGAAVTAQDRMQFASVAGSTWRVVGAPASISQLGGRPSHIEAVVELIT